MEALVLILVILGLPIFAIFCPETEAMKIRRGVVIHPKVIAPPDVKAHLRLQKRARLEAHYAKISKPRLD